jgi:hypothetical protein
MTTDQGSRISKNYRMSRLRRRRLLLLKTARDKCSRCRTVENGVLKQRTKVTNRARMSMEGDEWDASRVKEKRRCAPAAAAV